MDKIYYLAHRANGKILNSVIDFYGVDLFGPMQVIVITGIDLEMSEVFGEKLEFERYYLYLHFSVDFNSSVLTFLVNIQMMMFQMMTKSVQVMQCTCQGITVLTNLSINMLSLHGLLLWCLKSAMMSMRG